MREVYENSESWARLQDEKDPLRGFRDEFFIPITQPTAGPTAGNGEASLYFAGNSLGLQPRRVRAYVEQELEDWALHGVEGHLRARNPWYSYHELLTEPMARLVGAKPVEVVVMNTLSVNLHLMMVSFYRPTPERHKILIEHGAFPSDRYAVSSQARFHGWDPLEAIVEAVPRPGEATLRTEDLLELLKRRGKEMALLLFGNVNFLTGQAFDMRAITEAAHAQGCRVGWDLAHGAGNLPLALHDWNVDFAVWCGYKYLNSGPGGLAGCFVHERFAADRSLPRFEGWWGYDKLARFQMGPRFIACPGAEAWQLSNPPILPMAALRASLEIFERATMGAIRKKSERLTGFLEFLVDSLAGRPFTVLTPRDPAQRGAQLSLRYKEGAKAFVEKLGQAGALCDFREPDIVRLAPVALYNTFTDLYRLGRLLERYA